MSTHISADDAEPARHLFDELVCLPPEQRTRRLEAISERGLRDEVASLLAAFDQTGNTPDNRIAALDELHSLLARSPSDADPGAMRRASSAPPEPADPLRLTGEHIGRYAVEEHLGGGGMGVVYRARDTGLDRPVALKFLPLHLAASAKAKARFVQEAKAASALDHPHIGTIHEINETADGQLFIAMAYYAGETLKAKIARGPLPVEDALDYAIQIAEGLQRAHEAGIIHRDVKPANVMVTGRGQVKIVDFGLAKAAGQPDSIRAGQARHVAGETNHVKERQDVSLTRTGMTLGTVAYMSPEQARGQAVRPTTDLWSLGVVLYEMLIGERPFQGEHHEAVVHSILNEEPEPPLMLQRPKDLKTLAAVVDQCLQKDPQERYSSAKSLLSALRLVRNGTVPINSIAVLPFASPSSDPEEAYFTYGMTEALATVLSQIESLSVRAPASAMRYQNTDTPLPEIAQKLGVDALVSGSVFQAGEEVRITVHLIHGASGEQLWSNAYQKKRRDILTLQSKVAQAIAEEVKGTLTPEEETQFTQKRPVNPKAHRRWLVGNFHLTRLNQTSFRKALHAYQEAVDIDPEYAPAHAGIALAYIELGSWFASMAPENVFPQAKDAAQRALDLDPTVAEAHIALARVRQLSEWDWVGAERAYRRGIALNPSATYSQILYANYLTALGRFEESIKLGRKTLELDPLSPAAYNQLAFHLKFSGRDKETLELCYESLELSPNFMQTRVMLAMAHSKEGQSERALSHLEKIDSSYLAQHPYAMGWVGHSYAAVGQRGTARNLLAQLMERSKQEYISTAALAHIHLGLNEYEMALHWLERSVEARLPSMLWLKEHPWYDPLRDYPRFQTLIELMNFPSP